MEQSSLSAAILVGGRSRRMGTNKALLKLEPDGATVLETVAHTLSHVADHVMLVGVGSAGQALPDLPQIADRLPARGALGGIYTALKDSSHSHVLVVACDMPFLNVALLQAMISRPRTYDILVPLLNSLQPLHAIYAQSCIPVIESRLQAGEFKVTGWFDQVTVSALGEPTVRKLDPHLRSWFNMNTPEDVFVARNILANQPDR